MTSGPALRVAVVGLGYVGLGLCKTFVDAGYVVNGIDKDTRRIDLLRRAISPISDLSDSDIADMREKGFDVSDDYSFVSESDVVVLCLPTPLKDKNSPDLSYVLSAVSSVEREIGGRTLVILESTVAPGTTGGVVLAHLEANGKRLGDDFLLAFSPERVNPGAGGPGIPPVPKVVAGINEESLAAAVALYEAAGYPVVPTKSVAAAEASKLLENTYRAVNLALVHEITPGLAALGIDTNEVIRLASTKPFGFQAFYPGTGVGGHCIPIDPWYLHAALEEAEMPSTLIQSALKINDHMPKQVAQRAHELIQNDLRLVNDARVLVLGMTYKPNVNDFRESPGARLVSELELLGYEVGYHDPHLASEVEPRPGGNFENDLDSALDRYPARIVAQNHSTYMDNSRLAGEDHTWWASSPAGQTSTSIWSPLGFTNQEERPIGSGS
jgi:UDP-N-acetyl-D-glucosamine dehydrogenase